MSKTRKLLSVVVALMMVVSMFAMTANAAYYYESEEDAATYTQTWALSEPVDNGDGTYTVDVSLTTNYGTGPIQFVLTNSDTSVAAIQSVTLGDAIPESYNATLSVSKAKGKVMIIADTAGTATITAEEINGVIATVVYTYAGSGSAEIAIEDDAKSATNVGGSLIAARMGDGDVVTGDPITGQTVTVGDSVIIGGGAAPTLAVIDGTIGVIDTTRQDMYCDESGFGMGDATFTGYIYGVEPEYMETIDAVFEVVGDGYMSIVANDAGSEAGTGTIVEVYNNNDELVETYVLVIFGDVNGDGFVDAVDAGDIEFHDAWMYEASSNGMRFEYAYQSFAADVNCDYSSDAVDAGDIELHDAYMYETGTDGMRMYQADVMANIA